jgi:flagellar basal body-associated protein FliL
VARLKTREEKEMLRSAMPDRESRHFEKMAGNGRVKELFFTLFVIR